MLRSLSQSLHDVRGIEIHGVPNGFNSTFSTKKIIHGNLLVLILLVVLKESTNFCKSVRWKLLNVLVMTVLRIISTNSNDFVIFLTLSVSPKPEDRM
jgi:hypothetical protein